ncbi:perlucin-like protein [Acanthaster planci]|uniref:Perlucin-like protein n=1 Tax=Acanthaster planci TaxID=133434 RepID=A0A8B7ZCC8_ACAPL|nr:perlucin-like protein [Acanthaster planci]
MQWLQGTTLRVLFLVFATSSVALAQYTSCPSGWLNWQQSCYYRLPDKMNWFQASEACNRPGSSLTVPDSEEENFFLWQSIVKGPVGAGGLWIGCTDAAQEGTWLCGGQPARYTNWNSRKFRNSSDYNCARLTVFAKGKWSDDIPCSSKNNRSAACEMKTSTVPIYHTFTGTDGRVPQQCLHHHNIKNVPVESLLACGLACRATPRCRSFNLWQISKAERQCQLNQVTRLGADSYDFKATNNCFYFDL